MYLRVAYNVLRFLIARLKFGKRLKVSPLQRISPRCGVKLFQKGVLIVGRNCEFEAGCDIQVHGNGVLSIGEGTYMNRYCMISAHDSVTIGKGCMFGPSVKIFDNDHKFDAASGVKSELRTAPIKIGDRCWLASNVVILKGTEIGDNCVIGAGCVISGKIPSGSLVKLVRTQQVVDLG